MFTQSILNEHLRALAAAKARGAQLGAYRDGVYVGGKGTADTARNASEARTALFHANAMRRLPMLKRVDSEGTMSLRAVADALNRMVHHTPIIGTSHTSTLKKLFYINCLQAISGGVTLILTILTTEFEPTTFRL